MLSSVCELPFPNSLVQTTSVLSSRLPAPPGSGVWASFCTKQFNSPANHLLIRINKWFAGELNCLVQKLAHTPEPGGAGNLLDNTLVVWTNELGKGNSHTLDNIPFLLIGGGFGFQMGRSVKLEKIPHNRLHLALAHAVGHRIETFGKPALCEGGPLSLS